MTGLAPYAASESISKGRMHVEAAPEMRSEYQRDRDRIIHSSAFRRLEYKTQVFVNHEGDMFRTRLTHSLEVSQIGRTIARSLNLNEDLMEAICLAHDLGHTPFGHAGQDALNTCMKPFGGFEHNLQSLRVVDELEQKYATFPGLNLMYETREGILKHCSIKNARQLGELGKRFIDKHQPGLEAQIANIADEIAYNNHDVDDGLRAGLLTFEQLSECSIFREQYEYVRSTWPELDMKRSKHELIRRMISKVVVDLIDTSKSKLDRYNPEDIDAVRKLAEPVVTMSGEVKSQHLELKKFLMKNLYRHPKVIEMSNSAQGTVTHLFDAYFNDSSSLTTEMRNHIDKLSGPDETIQRARLIADYIAGMTDRFAIMESSRLRSN